MRRRIEPMTVDTPEWTTSIDPIDVDSGALERARDIAAERLKQSRRRRMIYNTGISLLARLTRVPELEALKTQTNEDDMPKRVKPYLKQKSTWEGIAAVLGAVGVTIYPEAMVAIVGGVFAVIGAIELWKQELEDE